ncbi:hypothetical protein [Flavobacterium sp.]|uniref:hypothetical protein n=1 Tax=Flavobacterium sp. TaxID=239 RepID=UPI002612EA71|nr:hypothetical protein [Flavobacterium sp.]
MINKNLKKLIIPAIGGLLIATYTLYSSKGHFEKSDFIVLLLTTLVILGVFFIINKITPKNN